MDGSDPSREEAAFAAPRHCDSEGRSSRYALRCSSTSLASWASFGSSTFSPSAAFLSVALPVMYAAPGAQLAKEVEEKR